MESSADGCGHGDERKLAMNSDRRGVLSWPVNLKGIVTQVTIHSVEKMRVVLWHPDSMNTLFGYSSNTVLRLLRGNRPPLLAKSHSSQEGSKRPPRK